MNSDLDRQIDNFSYLVVNAIPWPILDEPFRPSQDERTQTMAPPLPFLHAAEASLPTAGAVHYAVHYGTCKFIEENYVISLHF